MKASLIKQSEVHIQLTEQLTMTFGQNLLPFNIVKELLVILVLAQQYYQYLHPPHAPEIFVHCTHLLQVTCLYPEGFLRDKRCANLLRDTAGLTILDIGPPDLWIKSS